MEQINEKILNVFGYTKEELNCSNATTGISEVFENDNRSNEVEVLHSFIRYCTIKEFEELKIMLNGNDMSTIF